MSERSTSAGTRSGPALRKEKNAALISRLEQSLKRAKLSARKASLLATGTPDTVRMILIGQSTSPRTRTLSRLAEVLGVNLEWLATGRGPMLEQKAFSDRMIGDNPAQRSVFSAAHRVLLALQQEPFSFDLSDNDLNSLALTISRQFTKIERGNKSDLSSAASGDGR